MIVDVEVGVRVVGMVGVVSFIDPLKNILHQLLCKKLAVYVVFTFAKLNKYFPL